MNKKKKRNGFTIVELVIVIAVIGILSAVLIPTFSNLIRKAKQSADQQLVYHLNEAVIANETDNLAKGKNGTEATMYDTLQVLDKEYGFTVERMTPRSGNDIVWDSTTNRFALVAKDNTVVYTDPNRPSKMANKAQMWRITEAGESLTDGYSHYLTADWTGTVEVTTGVDVGENDDITSVTYARDGSAQSVVIHTNGGTLIVNAPSDTVIHYGEADLVDIQKVASASYHENGTVSLVKVANGRVALESESNVGAIHLAATDGEFDNITVAKANGVEMPDFSRDPVEIPAAGKKVVALQQGTADANANKDYVWLTAVGVYEQVTLGTVNAAGTNYAATSESATQEQKTTAQQIANNITATYDAKEYEVKAVKNGDNWEYQLVSETEDNITENVTVEVTVQNNNATASVTVGETQATASTSNSAVVTEDNIESVVAQGAAKTFAEIDSKEKLLAFRDAWNAGKLSGDTFKLTANIDISGENWYPIGTWEFPFNGTFDGNGKTIKGLYANSVDADHQGIYSNGDTVGFGETFGFFGIVGGGNTTIQNVSFTDVSIYIYNGKDVGAVIGYVPSLGKFIAANASGADHFMNVDKWTNESGVGTNAIKLSGITVSGNIKGNASVGGIAGKIYTSGKVEVLGCTNNANITGGSNTSGIVGYIHYSSDITVSGCTNTGTVKLTGGAGIVHLNDLSNKKITNNTNSGNIIYNASYSKTSANSYSWDFIATGIHNNYAYTEYHGNTNTGKFYIQSNEEPESTKGVLIVDAGETVTISSVSEYTDVLVNGTLNINAETSVYGTMWVRSNGTLNVNAPLTVNGTDGNLRLSNNALTVGANGSISATAINVPDNFTLTNNGTIHIKTQTEGLKKNNLTFVNNGTFIADSNLYYGENLHFTNNGTYQGNMILTGSATVINTENGKYEAHNGNGVNFRGGSGSFTNQAEAPFGSGFDGLSIWVAGTYTVEGCNAHLGANVTNLELTHEGNVWTATDK